MLKAVENLVKCAGRRKTCGNHSMERGDAGRAFIYHWSVICETDDEQKVFCLPYKGQYCGSVSTKRAVNDYKRYFEGEGYTLVSAI